MRKVWRPVSRLRPLFGQPPTAGSPATPPRPGIRVTGQSNTRQRLVLAGAVIAFGLTGATDFGTVEARGLQVRQQPHREVRGAVSRWSAPKYVVVQNRKFFSVFKGNDKTISGRVALKFGPRSPGVIVATPRILKFTVARVDNREIKGKTLKFAPRNPGIIITPARPLLFKVWSVDNRKGPGRVFVFQPHRPTSIFYCDRGLNVYTGPHVERRGKVIRIVPKLVNPSATGSLSHGLIRLSNLHIFLNVKREVDSGSVDALSSDVGGTQVLFNKNFKDIDSLTATVDSVTEPFIVIYDFNDVPNPTGFKVYVFDTTGNRVSKTVSWKARGIV